MEHRFGKTFGMAMPPVPPPSSKPVSVQFMDRPVFVSPTLAALGYRSSVWPYLEEIVAEIGTVISAARSNLRRLHTQSQFLRRVACRSLCEPLPISLTHPKRTGLFGSGCTQLKNHRPSSGLRGSPGITYKRAEAVKYAADISA